MTTLIWADEFEVDGAPCSENWFLETVPPNNGVGGIMKNNIIPTEGQILMFLTVPLK